MIKIHFNPWPYPPPTPKFHFGEGEGMATRRLFNPSLCAYQLHSSAVLHIVFVSFFFLFRLFANWLILFPQNIQIIAFAFLSSNSCLGQETFSSSVSVRLKESDEKNTLLAASSFIHQLIIYLFISLSKY